MCHSKRSFLSQSDALTAAERAREERSVALGTYRCPHCRQWHLTKRTGATAKLQQGEHIEAKLQRRKNRQKTDKQKLYDTRVHLSALQRAVRSVAVIADELLEPVPENPQFVKLRDAIRKLRVVEDDAGRSG
jgi:hypothetical protein